MIVRGRLKHHAPLGALTWFGTGGPADLLYKPADVADLQDFLRQLPADMPVMALGAGSNVLIRDGGIRGAVIRLGRGFHDIQITPDGIITAGGAALCATMALFAAEHGAAGLEFYSGIPGSIGGVLAMNAGAYGIETKDVLVDATLLLRDGSIITVSGDSLGMTYRNGHLPAGAIVLSARFATTDGDKDSILGRIHTIRHQREATQPIRGKTGGSTFTNPPGHAAWRLIEAAGCRGLRQGGAQVSEKHCNFLLNVANATAADIETLGEIVRTRVAADSGQTLTWEIHRVGDTL